MRVLLYLATAILTFALPEFRASAQFYEHTVLWEITGKNLSQPSYLFGTIRFVPKDQFEITKRVREKMKTCRILATEVLADQRTQNELNRAAHLPDDKSLEDLLTLEDYQLVKGFFVNNLGVTETKFNLTYRHLKPIVLSVAITQLHLGNQIRFYDQELRKIAKKNKIEALGLEEVEREIEAMDHYPLKDQAQALVHNVQNFEQHFDDFEALTDYYSEGDLASVLSIALRPMEGNLEFKRNFFDLRTSEWVPKMERNMDVGPTFFAVGAAHLPGPSGLIQKLRDRGYTLVPISVN